jgi:hypothetical protein
MQGFGEVVEGLGASRQVPRGLRVDVTPQTATEQSCTHSRSSSRQYVGVEAVSDVEDRVGRDTRFFGHSLKEARIRFSHSPFSRGRDESAWTPAACDNASVPAG